MACKETAPLTTAMIEAELACACVCVCHGSGRVHKVRGHRGTSPAVVQRKPCVGRAFAMMGRLGHSL